MQDTLLHALEMLETLLAKCERGKDSRTLVAEVGAIMESVEAAHSESLRNAACEKHASVLLENEARRSAHLQQQVAALLCQIDVLTKSDRSPIFYPPLAREENPSRLKLKSA